MDDDDSFKYNFSMLQTGGFFKASTRPELQETRSSLVQCILSHASILVSPRSMAVNKN